MDVKGTAFLARKKFVVEKAGEQAWDDFVNSIKSEIPSLSGIVLASALIPAQEFLRFQEKLTRELFNDDKNSYWAMGRESAEWSLSSGPYKRAVDSREVAEFASKIPSIWRSFYNEGIAALIIEPPFARFTVSELPIAHPYFEHVAAGFVQRALEMVTGKTPVPYRRTAGSATVRGYIYQFGPL